MMGTPAWFGTMLTNVSTGKSFSIDSFKGKVVLVETMAQSCPTCKQGELNIKAAEEKLGMPADLVTISLDVSATDATDALRSYAANNGFAWAFAVAPAAVSSEIGQLYGDQFLKLSSPGLLVIDRQGTAHPLPAGLSTTDDLLMALDPYLKGM